MVPSLDTPVCEAQTKRFNDEAAKLPGNVAVLTVSMDLPFAQARFCGQHGVDRIQAASDHRDAGFGRAYGTLIEPLRLEARALFVVGRTASSSTSSTCRRSPSTRTTTPRWAPPAQASCPPPDRARALPVTGASDP